MIYLGVGSSIGNAKKIFAEAEAFLETKGVEVVKKSKIHKTKPVGGTAKNDFSNAVWAVRFFPKWYDIWGSKPKKLLKVLKEAEKRAGRKFDAPRWSDRELDLDILTYDNRIVTKRDLTIPHPEIGNREFVLKPWAEIVGGDFSILCNGKIGICLRKVKKEKKRK